MIVLRRVRIPLLLALELVVAALLLIAAIAGVVAFPFDRRLRLTRVGAMGIGYVAVEFVGLAWALGLWTTRPFRSREQWDDANTRLAAWVLGRVLAWARRTVGFEVDLHEPEHADLLRGDAPVLVLGRHGGIGDSYTLAWVLAGIYHRRPRVVLKSLLRLEPLLDVLLTRLGACFLPDRRRRRESLEDRVAGLATDLHANEAILLFPEGANWTPKRRLWAIRRLWLAKKFDAARAASAMEHVLPPRPGGVLACVEARPDLAVVTFAHAGLDRLTTAGQLWAALPFANKMTLRWWPTAPVPPPGEREDWLTTEWAVLDAWVEGERATAKDR